MLTASFRKLRRACALPCLAGSRWACTPAHAAVRACPWPVWQRRLGVLSLVPLLPPLTDSEIGPVARFISFLFKKKCIYLFVFPAAHFRTQLAHDTEGRFQFRASRQCPYPQESQKDSLSSSTWFAFLSGNWNCRSQALPGLEGPKLSVAGQRAGRS